MSEQILKQLETLETNLDKKFEQHAAEVKNVGEAHESTKNEIKNLMDQYKDLSGKLEAFETKSNRLGGSIGNAEPKSFKDAFTKEIYENQSFKDFKSGAIAEANFNVKSVSHTGETYPATYLAGIVAPDERPVHVRQYMSTVGCDSDRIYYIEETVWTDKTTMRKPGELTSLSGDSSVLGFEQKDVPVRGISNILELPEESLADAAFVASYVPQRLMRGLMEKQDSQILYGSGNGSDLTGISVGATDFDLAGFTGSTSGGTIVDAIRFALKMIRKGEKRGSAIIMNPDWYYQLETLKDENKNYIFPGIFNGTTPTISGIPVYENTAVQGNDCFVSDMQRGARLATRSGVEVKVYNQHSSNLSNGLVAFKATERMAVVNERPSATVYFDLSTI